MRRTERDRAILDAVLFRVRMLSLEQIARTWWGTAVDAVRLARRRLEVLEHAGLIARHRVLARPLLDLERPEFAWEPGSEPPDVGAVSGRLRRRWSAPPKPTAVYLPTRSTIRELGGGGGRLPSPGQETHDLHTAEVFLRLLARDPERARSWKGEDSYKAAAAHGEKVPDALIVDELGEPELAVEFAGSYGSARLAEFHHHCEARELAYELW